MSDPIVAPLLKLSISPNLAWTKGSATWSFQATNYDGSTPVVTSTNPDVAVPGTDIEFDGATNTFSGTIQAVTFGNCSINFVIENQGVITQPVEVDLLPTEGAQNYVATAIPPGPPAPAK